jgi:SAM-dependent methyltransferase
MGGAGVAGEGRAAADPAFARNRRFYDPLWAAARLIPPESFNTWPLVHRLMAEGDVRRLEIGPGLRPRLPLSGSDFLDASPAATAALRAAGGRAVQGSASALPYRTGAFGLIVALDVIEHVADDAAAFAELARVAAPGAALLLSVPLDPTRWSRFDEAVGHCRRYRIETLGPALAARGWTVEASASFGLRPRWPALVALGMWVLARQPRRAMWWYNRLLPRAVRRQPPLAPVPGLAVPERRTDEVLLLARMRREGEQRNRNDGR